MSYPIFVLPQSVSTESLKDLVLSGEVVSLAQFSSIAFEAFVDAEKVTAELRPRALAAIAARHGLTYGNLVDHVCTAAIERVRAAIDFNAVGDELPDTDVIRYLR